MIQCQLHFVATKKPHDYVPRSCEALHSYAVGIANQVQESMTPKWLWYVKGFGLPQGSYNGSGELFYSFETWTNHLKTLWAVNSEVFFHNKQIRMIDEMLNITCDPLELWKYAEDGSN